MSRILMSCITIVFVFIIISATSAKETQMEIFKDLKVGIAGTRFHTQ